MKSARARADGNAWAPADQRRKLGLESRNLASLYEHAAREHLLHRSLFRPPDERFRGWDRLHGPSGREIVQLRLWKPQLQLPGE